ncbi:uncharacterized protein AKAW2_50873A [Aspergillus luchuensis]|uniref:Uncharacterized protein n=1 Tax=Aspergillus kawachii TaxID=1069201 RepID=A0A7R7WCP0_ASPKA|nr:uncharacterized protein AKAW2_50873A [Aspergillus luchuensis]BCS00532.1 hypothetical protein AKAW2_50873A [Aspergillus luchuensis]
MSSTSAPLATATTSGTPEQRSSGNMTEADTPKHSPPKPQSSKHDYKGFVAGVFSGIAKLSVGHPYVITLLLPLPYHLYYLSGQRPYNVTN